MAQQALRKVGIEQAHPRIAVERTSPAAGRPVLVRRPREMAAAAAVPAFSPVDELNAHVAELEAALDRARARLAELACSRPERAAR